MKKFIFTFPNNHPLGGHYQPVYAKYSHVARERMFERYGHYWGFQYTEEQWMDWEKQAQEMGLPIERELSAIYCREGE